MKRGRKSDSEITIRSMLTIANAEGRLNPPNNFTEAEMAIWLETVNDNPPDAFRATHRPLLMMYCRHVARAGILAEEITAFKREWLSDDEGLRRFDTLLKMAEREARAASSLATRLRLTRQAVEHRVTVGIAQANHSRTTKPWE